MKNKIPNILMTLFCIILAAGVMTIFRACAPMDDGTWMHCHYVQLDVFYIGIALCVLSILGIILKNRIAGIILNILTIILSVVAMLLPGTLMSMCMMDTMRCHSTMKPFVRVMGILIILTTVISLILEYRKSATKQ